MEEVIETPVLEENPKTEETKKKNGTSDVQ